MSGYPPVVTTFGLSSLAETQAALIVLHSSPKDALRTRASSKSGVLAKAANSQLVWHFYAERFFGLVGDAAFQRPDAEKAERAGCEGSNVRAMIQAFSLWHAAARKVGLDLFDACLPLPADWLAVWQGLHEWTSKESAQGLGEKFRLRGPADPAIFKACADSGLQIAPEVAGLWKIHDGQAFREQEDGDDDASGLFGGYAVYNHFVSTRLLPLEMALEITMKLRGRLPDFESKLIFAKSGMSKFFVVDVTTAEVSIISPGQRSVNYQPASPSCASELRTGLLRWFREYVRRLNADFYPVLPLQPSVWTPESNRTLGLCLCPQSPPEATCCVTKGVEVRASCTYMPEHPQGWTYSISCRLVGTAAERGYEQCQLHTRTWKIQEDGNRPQEVHGEGVIGLFPILVDGGWTLNRESDPHGQYQAPKGFQAGSFRYQSCSGRSASMRGSFGGLLTFVPGTTRNPKGAPFQAYLEPFRTYVPEFIY